MNKDQEIQTKLTVQFLDKIIVKRNNIIGYEHFTKKREMVEEKKED